MDISSFDLNLLKALDVLLREKHVSRAATVLHISQPAMSRTLGRLREEFADELLVRDGNSYSLTMRAEQLIEPVRSVLTNIDGLMRPATFNPQDLDGQITIASLDLEMKLYFSALVRRTSELAPRLSLRAMQFSRGDFGILDSAEADFVIVSLDSSSGRYRRRLLYANSYVSVVGTKLAKKFGSELSLEHYAKSDHGLVTVEGVGEGFVDVAMHELGLQRKIIARVPNFMLVPDICAQREIIFTVPRRIVNTFPRDAGLMYYSPPITFPASSSYLYWHARNHSNPINIWFRKLIFECNAAILEDDNV